MSLESLGSAAGVWGPGAGMQIQTSLHLLLCYAASPWAAVVLGQEQISQAESHQPPLAF